MFTGIVEEVGTVASVHRTGEIIKVRVRTSQVDSTDRIGDSICINGVCLTVVSLTDQSLEFDLSLETARTTTLGSLRVSDRVNMERALRLSDRLGGHLLSGHIDGVGYIRKLSKNGWHYLLGVAPPKSASCYLVDKGSIGLDGISLTVASLEDGLVWVSVIPHTAEVTTLKEKKTGDAVNVEADLLAKYVHRLLTAHPLSQAAGSPENSTLGKEFLAKHGFLS
ncbi:MAG: riboflavin synthase [bacterium]